MAFFPTTYILDNFNRANANPITGGQWVNSIFPGDSNMQIVNGPTNGQVKAVGVNGTAYWNVSFGPDMEVYYDVITLPGTGQAFTPFLRCSNPGTNNLTGYQCYFENDSPTQHSLIFRVDNTPSPGTQVQIGTTQAITLVAGDSIGASIVGNLVTSYIKHNGVWSSVNSATDSTYTGTGVIAMEIDDTTGVIDNFGGGTYQDVLMGGITL